MLISKVRSEITSRLRPGLDYRTTSFKREFDPGSERTLAACLTHASRVRSLLEQYRGPAHGARVRNTWVTCPEMGDNPAKAGHIPHTTPPTARVGVKARKRAVGGAYAR